MFGNSTRLKSVAKNEIPMIVILVLNKLKNPGKYQELIKHASVLARAEGLTAHDLSLKKRKD